ncbi:MAG: hypothetical protein L0177_20385, partial [Chloroflexi bacterium]|nr:hypothetical protein [Chloroflexota bacterium]
MRRRIFTLVTLSLALAIVATLRGIALSAASADDAEADLAAVSKEIVDLPAEIPVNEAVAFEVTEEVANFGPAGPVLAEVYEVL